MRIGLPGFAPAAVLALSVLASRGGNGGDEAGELALGGDPTSALQGKLAWCGAWPSESDYELFAREFGVPRFKCLARNAGDDTDPTWSPDGKARLHDKTADARGLH